MRKMLQLAAFARPYRGPSLLALLLLTALVALDLAIPRLIQRIIDQGVLPQNHRVVVATGLLMIGISLLSALIAVANNLLSVRVGESVARDLREALFVKIQRLSYGNLDRLKTGQLMVRLTSDTAAFQRLVQVSLRIGTRAPLLMIGSLALMIHTSPRLALSLLPLLLLTAALIVFFVWKMEPLFHAVQRKMDRLNTVLQENIAGVRLVKAFVRADSEARRFQQANAALADDAIHVMRFTANMSPVLTVCVNIGVVVVIWYGGLEAIRGGLTVGQIVAFTNYLLTTMTPLIMMTMLANVWAGGIASARRLSDVLQTKPDIQDPAEAGHLPPDASGRIEFQAVGFDYGVSGAEPVLRDIDLVAEAGTTVALLGATGAGKTTLANLVPRFYDVRAGRILIDGHDVRHLDQEDLRRHIAIVPQEAVLFSGTVRDNIRYGRPAAEEAEVTAAARTAQAHDFIRELPQAYDTRVEERGVNLSGGQKQRIAIARALITQPRILILDDSTSAVDVATETRIQAALDALPRRPTRLVVAQRISTVLTADKIVVIDRGRIAGQGTHAELMQSCLIYREIYDSQLGGGLPANNAGDDPTEGRRP
jgi:ATP-binding cassette subfamily B multidrug efflux pump